MPAKAVLSPSDSDDYGLRIEYEAVKYACPHCWRSVPDLVFLRWLEHMAPETMATWRSTYASEQARESAPEGK